MSEPSFYFWRRRLAERDAALDAEAAAFVPVRLVDETAAVVSGETAALEVVLREGCTVRVRPGFDAATLRQLLAVLEDQPC